jgi:hypothetical protein
VIEKGIDMHTNYFEREERRAYVAGVEAGFKAWQASIRK